MIPVRQYRAFWTNEAQKIGNIGHTLFVRTEDELNQCIKEVADKELILVAVIPSADTTAPDLDNIREHEVAIIYVLVKVSRNNMDAEDLVAIQEKAQDKIKLIKQSIRENSGNEEAIYHLLCRDIDLNKMHTDPEFNFLECDGYSLSLQFNTTGF